MTSEARTALITHPACTEHDMGIGHPEQPARLTSVLDALSGDGFRDLVRIEAPRASIEQIARSHPKSHIEGILNAVPEHGVRQVDPDTALSAGSGEAALRAAGAGIEAVDRVMRGEIRNVFCAVRPPGHHAEPEQAMGFCLFNNVAIAAEHAIATHGAAKVAVVDFDVHHGNGTQAMFINKPHMFFASTHQMPLYPGTGHESERGIGGNIVNAALPPNASGDEFRIAFRLRVLPALLDFDPDLIIISAGFDAHADDPLANVNLVEDDYIWATRELMQVADKTCQGRVISMLEGGYDLGALGRSSAAHVITLME